MKTKQLLETLKGLFKEGWSHSEVIAKTKEMPHNGYDAAQDLLVVYVDDGVVIIAPYYNVISYFSSSDSTCPNCGGK